jgi:radical SAM protein with 4Fe4S-binding SPASM domain
MFAFDTPESRLSHIRRLDIDEYWRQLDCFILGNTKQGNPDCRDCWAAPFCTGCMGSNQVATGTLAGNEPINCQIVKQSAESAMAKLAELQDTPERWASFIDNWSKIAGGNHAEASC